MTVKELMKTAHRRGGPTADDIVAALKAIYAHRTVEVVTS